MSLTVSVPQSEGEVILSEGGTAPIHYPVEAGQVQVDEADVAWFLENVAGSRMVESATGRKPRATVVEGESTSGDVAP